MNISRRFFTAGMLGAATLSATGCMTKPLRPLNADGSYCYVIGKQPRAGKTCTTRPVPGADIEALAKRFEPDPQRLTIYVVRQRWGDAENRVAVSADDGQALETLPRSFVVLRLDPGEHRLQAIWRDGMTDLAIKGRAGELAFVELVGSAWTWSATYRFEPGDPNSRKRAATLKLVGVIG